MDDKVCILSTVHQALDTRIFDRQAKSLAGAGYDVTLIAQHERDEVVDGVKIVLLPKPDNRFVRMLGIWRLFKLAYAQKADIYHFHDPELLPVGLLLKLLMRGRVIYDVHEDYPKDILTKYWIPYYLRWLLSLLYTLVERASFFFFDAVFVAGKDIAWHFPRSSKLTVIGNYPSLEKARLTEKEKMFDNKPAVAIYIGDLTVDRCAREMVQAINLLEGKAKLVLLGTFSDPNLENEIRMTASGHVELVGHVPYETVFSYLRESDVGLICFHPNPNNIAAVWRNRKLFEYMAAGLPVIVSNFPLWKEIIEENRCGIAVNPLNPKEIAKAVEYIINHSDEAKKMGINGKNAVIEKYNWEKESEKLLAVYQDLLKGGN